MTETALVLGAGGVTGSAWETGILYGLAKAGVDLTGADLIIGSSAGAAVGGVHSPANAHLAAGHGRVIVVAPTASGNKAIASPRSQAAELAAKGARVEVITPDAAAKKAFGHNPLDPGRRAAGPRRPAPGSPRRRRTPKPSPRS
ncbi:hypothetical protein [Streptomyces sp. NBC_01241]|uniref:hypothetical protein n=1 Tax=Streptomyces sp. NBC_01241 TaxID=2903794 RepID=UPI003D80A88A